MAAVLPGIIPPVSTPFTAGRESQWGAVRAQVQRMLELGIHGLNVGDGTGAGQALDRTSWPTMASVGSEAAGDVRLIAE